MQGRKAARRNLIAACRAGGRSPEAVHLTAPETVSDMLPRSERPQQMLYDRRPIPLMEGMQDHLIHLVRRRML